MNKYKKNTKGFTLLELMMSAFLLSLAGMMVLSISVLALKADRNARVESMLFSEGHKIMERVQFGDRGLYGIMKASAATVTISADQKTISFTVDKNPTYTVSTADDITTSIYFDNGDGDDATVDDNTLMVDPDTSIGGDEFSIGSSISAFAFSDNGNVITLDMTITETVSGIDVNVDLTRSIWMRNS